MPVQETCIFWFRWNFSIFIKKYRTNSQTQWHNWWCSQVSIMFKMDALVQIQFCCLRTVGRQHSFNKLYILTVWQEPSRTKLKSVMSVKERAALNLTRPQPFGWQVRKHPCMSVWNSLTKQFICCLGRRSHWHLKQWIEALLASVSILIWMTWTWTMIQTNPERKKRLLLSPHIRPLTPNPFYMQTQQRLSQYFYLCWLSQRKENHVTQREDLKKVRLCVCLRVCVRERAIACVAESCPHSD